jgi:hypothetical protein
MKQMKIIEDSLLIAQFMGYTQSTYDHGINGVEKIWKNDSLKIGHYKTEQEFDYHINWNSLISVVKKIESLGYFCMINKWTSIYTDFSQTSGKIQITTIEGNSKIKNTYQAIVAFIKWYNTQKL